MQQQWVGATASSPLGCGGSLAVVLGKWQNLKLLQHSSKKKKKTKEMKKKQRKKKSLHRLIGTDIPFFSFGVRLGSFTPDDDGSCSSHPSLSCKQKAAAAAAFKSSNPPYHLITISPPFACNPK
jgi:hypothetical protein